jgi:adenylate kinase
MNNLKRIGLYGISGTGKTTILKEVAEATSNLIWLEGSRLVTDAAGLTLDKFKKLSDSEKYFYREKAIERAFEIQNKENKHIIIDGHLVFAKGENDFENVMTKADATFYTDYIYLNLPTEIILQRQQNDTVRKRNHNANTISNWKVYELKELKLFCNKNNLPLHILETADTKSTVDFICNYIRE